MSLSMAAAGSSVGRRWTPLELGTSLTGWYDAQAASSVTSDANGVSQWNDLSGNGYHLTQSTNANKPGYADDRLSFDQGDWLNSTLSVSEISRCVAAVVQYTTATDCEVIVAAQEGNGNWGFGRKQAPGTDARKIYIAKAGVTNILVSAGTLADNVYGVVLGNTTSSTSRVSINGTATTGTHSQTLTANRTMRIGAAENGVTAVRFKGYMREIVVASELSVANQELLEGYLAHKWGLAGNLPAGHPYKNIGP